MDANDSTTIRIKRTTVAMLKEIGKKSETYDDIIRRLINAISEDH
jgi:hypothetical protein